MGMNSCSMRVKKSPKVGLPKLGWIHLDFVLKGGGFIMNTMAKKKCLSMCVLNLFQDFLISCLKFLVGVHSEDKPLVRPENSSPVNVWWERLYIMLLLYWEVYNLMDLVVNLRNEDLY